MKIRLAFLTITLIAAIASMFAYMSFIQTKTYENELVLFDGRLTIIISKFADLQEEDRKLNSKIDDLNKQIVLFKDQIRIQDALIAETRTRIENRAKAKKK
jgi:peptidoglycan hydrolase CwlO-like protein